MLKPLLRWAGGKTWLIPKMRKLYEPHRAKKWVDPFCGGLALPLALNPERASLGDLNPHLIELYQQIKFAPRLKPLNLENEETAYYRYRAYFNESIAVQADNREERALLFYYLNKTCFNGLCRFNSSGLFNVPFGDRRKVEFPDDFADYRQLFSRWYIARLDYRSFQPKASDFLYLDPPYDGSFTGYNADPFGWEQQQELVGWASRWKCPIVISNKATDRIVDLYEGAGFKIEILSAPRNIAGNRTPVNEVLATKNL